ncbi:putative ankyrin repeat protein RF_0381 [Schistocerca nitens]|uniref:putative ankyrin repeat protein RF_0381 n=1 Tax=Schistocerca nitens TaxID=7011 RepID=UPI002117C1EA|nr:putative ankyrin repeat protein RF_0381 [Schistocerca nitens]
MGDTVQKRGGNAKCMAHHRMLQEWKKPSAQASSILHAKRDKPYFMFYWSLVWLSCIFLASHLFSLFFGSGTPLCTKEEMTQEEISVRAMRQAVYNGDVDALKELISKGANSNAEVRSDEPLLLCAAVYNEVEIIRYLLKDAQVPIESRNKRGHTAFLTAASCGSLDAVRCMLSVGADVLARTALDETALHLSARTESVETFKFLQESGIPVDALDIRGRTVLHHAAQYGYPNMVECILQGGWLPVDCQDKDGQTPLMLTADFPRRINGCIFNPETSHQIPFAKLSRDRHCPLILDAADIGGRAGLCPDLQPLLPNQ